MNVQVVQATDDQEILVPLVPVALLLVALLVHVPEIVHHVPEIAQSPVQVGAVAMIELVQRAMSQMVVQ
jgi:hypothetical protein